MRFSLSALRRFAPSRPPGYVERVLALGQVRGSDVLLDDEIWHDLHREFTTAMPNSPWTGDFDRVVIINLRRRDDRRRDLESRLLGVPWRWREPEWFEAIDGLKLPTPRDWPPEPGTYGCMQSHRHVLERAILDGIGTLLVMEDDACFGSDFSGGFESFMRDVPDDWGQLMLGGQLTKKGKRVAPGVLRVDHCHRTHAYVVRGQFLRDLYAHLCASVGHADHRMGDFQEGRAVYAPDPFLVCQAPGFSDIAFRDTDNSGTCNC